MRTVTDPVLTGKVCPYCGKESELTDSSEIYGTSYGPIYICRDCNAYVGCREGTTIALGRLANAELRTEKRRAHHYLDQLWQSGKHGRFTTYTWLSRQLGIPREITHIGMSDVEQCDRIVRLSVERMKKESIEFELWPGDDFTAKS